MNEHICVSVKLYFQSRQQRDLACGPQFAGPDIEETKTIKYKDVCTTWNHHILQINHNYERKMTPHKSKNQHLKANRRELSK